jgi:predicted DNA-binding transcriptional regulator AlpA
MTPSPPSLADAIKPVSTIADLCHVLSCSRDTIDRLRAAGKFPPPDLRVGRGPRWRAETVLAWIERGGRP